jgi:hypothetical protein
MTHLLYCSAYNGHDTICLPSKVYVACFVLLVFLICWQGGLVGPWLLGEVVTQTGSYADAM